MLDGGGEALHSGGNGHALAISAVDDGSLVNVNADDLAADLGSSLSSRGVDTAAAGEYDLGAVGLIPGIHNGSDVGIAVELTAVDVVQLDIGETQSSRSGVNALYEAVAVTHNSGNGHAAQEAQVLIAQLHGGVAGHVAAELFLVHRAVQVGGELIVVAQVALRLRPER